MKYFGKLVYCEWLKNFTRGKFIFACVILGIVAFITIFVNFYIMNIGTSVPVSREQEYQSALNSYEQDPTPYRELKLMYYQQFFDDFSKLMETEHLSKSNVANQMYFLYQNYYSYQYVLEHFNQPELTNLLDSASESEKSDAFYISLKNNSQRDYESVVKFFSFYEQEFNHMHQAVQNDSYYHYAQYVVLSEDLQREFGSEDLVVIRPEFSYAVENKIDDYQDIRLLNYQFYQGFKQNLESNPIPSREKYRSGDTLAYRMDTYEQTVQYYEFMHEYWKEGMALTKYGIEHQLKTDIPIIGDNLYAPYQTSQTYMNYGLSLGVVILFLLILTNSSIVSKEYEEGTVKLLYTKKAPRWEILLAKICYLIILMYLFWIVGSIFYFLFSGLFYGFGDLLSSKLLYVNGVVVELPYLICYFRELLISSLPVIFFICFLYGMSSFLSNVALTASLLSIVSLFSAFFFSLVSFLRDVDFSLFFWTPFPYLNMRYVLQYNDDFIYSQVVYGISRTSFVLPCVIGIVLVLGISFVVLNFQDVKTKA